MSETRANVWHSMVAQLRERNPANVINGAVVARTDVLLPNGSQCVLEIQGGAAGERITVSDAGAAMIALSEAGFEMDAAAWQQTRAAARRRGLRLEGGGTLRSDPFPIGEAAYALVMTANAVKDVLEVAFSAAKRHEQVRFRERVQDQLADIFKSAIINKRAHVRGSSGDDARFDFLVSVSPGHSLVVDAPVPEQTSVSNVVLKHSDVRAARIPHLSQAIVYDEADKWPANTLAKLQLAGVPVVSARGLREGLLSAIKTQDQTDQ